MAVITSDFDAMRFDGHQNGPNHLGLCARQPRGMGLMIGLSLKTKDGAWPKPPIRDNGPPPPPADWCPVFAVLDRAETSAFNTAEGPPSGQMVDRFHTEVPYSCTPYGEYILQL